MEALEPFIHSVNGLGTADLLSELNSALETLEALHTLNSESEAADLIEQIKDLVDITAALNDLATRERRNPSLYPGAFSAADLVHLQSIVRGVAMMAEECTMFTTALRASLNNISHERKEAGYPTPESQFRNQMWYDETFYALKLRTEVLRVLFSAINLLQHRGDEDEDDNLSKKTRSLASTLHYQITVVETNLRSANDHSTDEIQSAVTAAKAVTTHIPATTNKHFAVVRSARTFYTGRVAEMAILGAAFEDTASSHQKRFVVFGLSGCGKTELALKYAEEHMNEFWGVFFVDGSSRKNASGSYAEIATIGGVEPNERAAKNWLKTRDLPWLLIVDNVDDDEVQLDDLIPQGPKGCVLMTSRNPAHKTYGNVGRRFLELQTLEKEEANELILRAAEEPSPWPLSVKDAASTICRALGFLPLALVHAAKAILVGACSWTGYLLYNERQRERIRRERLRQRSRSASKEKKSAEDDIERMNIFSSYEILYQSMLSSQDERFQDAIELLHVFSYMHFQNIRLDIFIGAAINPLEEAEQRKKEAIEDKTLQKKLKDPKPKTWSMWLRELRYGLKMYLDTPPPLPSALKHPAGLTQSEFKDDVHNRLSDALAVLARRSLILRQSSLEDRYSMHPLVHRWVRERPEMSTPYHSLWCQITLTTLAKSIPWPPLGDTEKERSMRRDLHAHIEHARACEVILKKRREESKALSKSAWLATEENFGRLQADECGRFSRVYSECGYFVEALHLQESTLNFVTRTLGEDHPLSIRLTLFTSGTLWELSRVAEATRLQRRARKICIESLGEDHPLSLEVAESLGSALMLKGRWAEAQMLHESNVEKLCALYGEEHEKTLKAIRNAARVHRRQMNFEKATNLFQMAWEGMKKSMGEVHLETLTCLEDLAMSYNRIETENLYPRSEEHLRESHERMKFVLEQRRQRLGKEQPYTLLATFYVAQLKAALGQHDVAVKMISDLLVIAGRNVGEQHTAVLGAKCQYGRILIEMGQFEKAEVILRDVAQKKHYKKFSDEDGDHPDRLGALWYLISCLEKQSKIEQALEECDSMAVGLKEIGGRGLGSKHKIASKLQEKRSGLESKLNAEVQNTELEPCRTQKLSEQEHRVPDIFAG